MTLEAAVKEIEQGQTSLGIELGSTRIKAVVIGSDYTVLASGSHGWENRLENHIWTYSLEDIWGGLQACYADLKKNIQATYGVTPKMYRAMGFSAMMHGYMAFNKAGDLLVPFRTWRNTMTGEASAALTKEFDYPIPQRWSIAHLYQAILNEEPHVKEVSFFTTLAGYVHWKLTGRKILGVGEASGMFPIDRKTGQFNVAMIEKFDRLVSGRADKIPWKLADILPAVVSAGTEAGVLTEEGARLLDPAGDLQAGVLLCPPEGDAGTGMVATNAVAVGTGNTSAGTSVFTMVVLEKELSSVYEQLDLVTTPAGDLVAMVHCNNCTSDLNAWVGLFRECLSSFGCKPDVEELYGVLYRQALLGDMDCGGLLAYNYFSGEHVVGLNEGRPLFVRKPDATMSLANFMRTHLYSALGALKVGLDILIKKENVTITRMMGHGGLYKTPEVGQRITAAAMNAPVSVMETAGEGGAWGMALLAAYCAEQADRKGGFEAASKESITCGMPAPESLEEFLDRRVFAGMAQTTLLPDPEDVKGFDAFMETYRKGLAIEKAAVENL